MKKIIIAILIAALMIASGFVLFSCGEKAEDDGPPSGGVPGGDDPKGSEDEAETEPPVPADIDLQALVDIGSIIATPGVKEEESAANIFDGDVSTKWCALQNTLEVEWKMLGSVIVNYYYFTTANDAPGRNPEDWIFYGSSDGEDWVELSNIEGAGIPSEFFENSDIYNIQNPQSFEYYKLSIIKVVNPDLNVAQFSEFNFYSSAK